MKKIAIYCVCFHSDEALGEYLFSIEASRQKEDCLVDVFVRNNDSENLGYFGGIERLMSEHSPSGYDYVIVSNVDIKLSTSFFHDLLSEKEENGIGWIAPQIASSYEHCDKNPKNLRRYSKRSLLIMRFLFRHPWVHSLYHHTLHKLKNHTRLYRKEIYAGHGSFVILTAEYVNRCGIIHYPPFLYCEEIYLAEQCRKHKLKVVYLPTIMVYDTEHIATGKLPRKLRCRYNEQAIDYILKEFYTGI